MLTCNDDLLQLYVDGTLQPAESAIVELHLKECLQCRRRAFFYKALSWDLSQIERITPAPENDPGELTTLLQAEWRRLHRPAHPPSALELSTLWVTANPALAEPARLVGDLGHAGLEGLGQVGRKGLRSLGRWLRRKGGKER